MVGCGKEFMNDESFNFKDGGGYAPSFIKTIWKDASETQKIPEEKA